MYLIPKVKRGMHGKTKSKVDEVMIVGIPNQKLQNYCIQHRIYITNKAVYNSFTNEPLLFRCGDSLTYVEKEKLNG